MSRWVRQQSFPQGFDVWCRHQTPPPPSVFEPHATFANFSVGRGLTAVAEFINSVTRENKHWSKLSLDSPNKDAGKWSLKFRPQTATAYYDQVTIESTDVWNLSITGGFKALEIVGLTAWSITFEDTSFDQPIRFINCVIGKLKLREKASHIYQPSLQLQHCWIGTLVLPPGCTKNLTIEGGGIANIDCPPADGPNPFKGAVIFKDVLFPTTVKQTSLFEGSQAYRSLHAHLKKHDNIPAANLMRALQLRSERSEDKDFTWLTNWIYGTFANYGTSPGRPLLWLLGLFVVAVMAIFAGDQGVITQSRNDYVGAYGVYLDESWGRITRSLMLPLQAIVNPFGIFFDTRKLIAPCTSWGAILLTIQGLCSDIFILMTVLSIRRRFKAE